MAGKQDVKADEELAAEASELQDRVAVLEAENAALKRQLAAQRGQTTRARAALAEAVELAAVEQPRSFPVNEHFAHPLPPELVELLADAEEIELAFCGPDGSELTGIAPRRLQSDMLVEKRGKVVLNVPLLIVTGPMDGERNLAGYVLLIDGEVAAMAARPSELVLGAGQQYQLQGDIAF